MSLLRTRLTTSLRPTSLRSPLTSRLTQIRTYAEPSAPNEKNSTEALEPPEAKIQEKPGHAKKPEPTGNFATDSVKPGEEPNGSEKGDLTGRRMRQVGEVDAGTAGS